MIVGHNGFTLIELLIVIAIIGVLAAVLIPNLLNARKSASDSQAQMLVRNVVTIAEMKRSENSDIPVYTVVTACAPILLATLPNNVQTCAVRQDTNTSYALVQSSTGNYFEFDGTRVLGPLAAPPASW